MEEKNNGVKRRVRLVFGIVFGTILMCVAVAAYFLAASFFSKGEDLLLQVLRSKETFIGDSGQPDRLREYVLRTTGDAVSAPDRYTLIDLDGDGAKEMVVYVSHGEGEYLVFHIYDGKVYSFAFDGKDFQNLKADGSFVQSKNSYTNYFYTLHFEKTEYRLTELAYQNRTKSKARINGQETTKSDVTLFAIDFWKKPSAQWTAGPEGVDPMPLYRDFLDGKAAAMDNWVQKKLSDYIPADGTYGYAFYDMTGDGMAELCVNSDYGIAIFTARGNTLRSWYTADTSATKLMGNGMVLDMDYEYDLLALYYGYRGLTEQGHTMFSLPFSWNDIKYAYPDLYDYNGQEVTQVEYGEKAKEYLDLEEMSYETVGRNTQPSNYDSLLLQVVNNEKTFLNEADKAVYLEEHIANGDPIGFIRTIRYTLVDMDGDGTNEMVVFSLPSRCYTVFRIYKGQVYGYDFAHTSMQNLKTDGSFVEQDIHGNACYLKLTFEDTGYKIHELAYCNASYQTQSVCRIGGKYATWEQVSAFRQKFTLKPDALWQSVPSSGENNTYALYQAFVAGEITATNIDGRELSFGTYLSADSGAFAYTLLDMTGDGQEELFIKQTYSMRIFAVKDGRVFLLHTADAPYSRLLNNGALLRERHGAAPTRINYEYRELDENGAVKFEIAFAWYDGTTIEEGVVHPDRYEINFQEVTKEEYEEKVLQYLQIGSDRIIWYPTAEKPGESTPPVTPNYDTLLLSVLKNETAFIDEAGRCVYLEAYKLGAKLGVTEDIAAVPEKYTLVDLDGDGTNELVVYVTPSYGAYLVFRVYEDQVYGYEFGVRSMTSLNKDGSFVQSNAAGINYYVTMYFEGAAYKLFGQAYSNSVDGEYRISGKYATADQVFEFIQDFSYRSDASWKIVKTGPMPTARPFMRRF